MHGRERRGGATTKGEGRARVPHAGMPIRIGAPTGAPPPAIHACPMRVQRVDSEVDARRHLVTDGAGPGGRAISRRSIPVVRREPDGRSGGPQRGTARGARRTAIHPAQRGREYGPSPALSIRYGVLYRTFDVGTVIDEGAAPHERIGSTDASCHERQFGRLGVVVRQRVNRWPP